VANSVPGIRETAAIAVSPPGGGPSLLWIFGVLQADCDVQPARLKAQVQQAIRQHLNPLFKIAEFVTIDALPRTPSHKIMRRLLRTTAAKPVAD